MEMCSETYCEYKDTCANLIARYDVFLCRQFCLYRVFLWNLEAPFVNTDISQTAYYKTSHLTDVSFYVCVYALLELETK